MIITIIIIIIIIITTTIIIIIIIDKLPAIRFSGLPCSNLNLPRFLSSHQAGSSKDMQAPLINPSIHPNKYPLSKKENLLPFTPALIYAPN